MFVLHLFWEIFLIIPHSWQGRGAAWLGTGLDLFRHSHHFCRRVAKLHISHHINTTWLLSSTTYYDRMLNCSYQHLFHLNYTD